MVHHNLAIADELGFGEGRNEWAHHHWANALSHWAETLASDLFWEYFRQRITQFDDPRVQLVDIEHLQAELPSVLIGFDTLFARTYGQAEQEAVCRKHLNLIRDSKFPTAVKRTAIVSVASGLVARRMEPLVQRVQENLLDASGKFTRQQFDKICTPLLDEAFAIHRYLVDDLRLSHELAQQTEFDRLGEKIISAIDTKVDYDNDDRERSILNGMLLTKRMLRLPMSSHVRRRLEASLRSDTEILYRGYGPSPTNLDLTKCWFMEGEEADPDASILIPVYRITNRSVEVNVNEGSAGVRLSYSQRRLLIPRSARARTNTADA